VLRLITIPIALSALVVDFLNIETYFRPLEKRKSGRYGATAKTGEDRILICEFSIVIGHLTVLKLAGFHDKWQITNEKSQILSLPVVSAKL
jgi:hypothetical protein